MINFDVLLYAVEDGVRAVFLAVLACMSVMLSVLFAAETVKYIRDLFRADSQSVTKS